MSSKNAASAAANEAKKLAEAMRKTLNLPHTAFPMRANAARREPELHARCVTSVYEANRLKDNSKKPKFILHDGPPFANGSLHMGHFLNKVLKDIINRYKLMRGFQLDYVPGWDCHGLPIEMKALEKLKSADVRNQLSASEVRRLSRELATGAIEEQKKDIIRWGILADWSGQEGSYYTTMDPSYEVKQYDVLKKMVQNGLIFRGFKPVYWSPSSRTALAESELEYMDNHISHAAYIRFSLHQAFLPEAKKVLDKYNNLACIIWTTTPWTIPANQALCVNPALEYAVLKFKQDQHFLIAKELVESFVKTALEGTEEYELLESIEGKFLHKSTFDHPIFEDRKSIMLLGDHVTTDAGTGIVHTAPGHGQDDYFAWINHFKVYDAKKTSDTATIICPVDHTGHFTLQAGKDLQGLEVLKEGNKQVLAMLTQSGHLVHVNKYKHRYPYDWRTKKPVILRATAQWFAKLDNLHAIGKQVLETQVEMFPKSSRRRLEATLSSRNEWCISRQRAWGLPIPVFYHKDTEEPLINEATISHLQSIIENYQTPNGHKGADCWWDLSVKELLPSEYADKANQYIKGMDTLDVWFDSGSSWYTVLKDSSDQVSKQADVYLEGSDQHRGWFQSSLLTSIAMQKASPYKKLITHGFTLDEKGTKMSKSLGNTLIPNDFIEGTTLYLVSGKNDNNNNNNNNNKKKKKKQLQIPAYGVDVLRYWVATTDYSTDVNIGPSVIGKVSDSLRKVRNTARFLLANLNDFDPSKHAVAYENLSSIDRYMLHLLNQLALNVTEGYEAFTFNRVQHAISHFISTDLSAFYMEASKDRLYCDSRESTSRRAAQTILWLTLQSISKAIAPVVCHTAEDIRLHWMSQIHKCDLDQVKGSIFTDQDGWLPNNQDTWHNDQLAKNWQMIRHLRFEVNRLVEKMRAKDLVGSQLECNVTLLIRDDQSREQFLQLVGGAASREGLENVFLCSGVDIVGYSDLEDKEDEIFRGACQLSLFDEDKKIEVELIVSHAKGHKCPRCWKFAVEVDEHETNLCFRCATATGLQKTSDLASQIIQED